MTIAIVTAWHGRPELTRKVAEHYRFHGGPKIAACTQEEADLIGPVEGWETVIVPQNVVSDKFNAACQYARGLGVQGVCIIGSDDLLSRSYLTEARKYIWTKQYIVPNGLYFFDQDHNRGMFMLTSGYPGCGRILREDLLDALDWEPYEQGLMRFLEGSMAQRLMEIEHDGHVIDVSPGTGLYVVDVKSADNIWPYDQFSRAPYVQHMEPTWMEEVFGWEIGETQPYVVPVEIDRYHVEADEERATVELRFSVSHDISVLPIPDILNLVASHMGNPVKPGSLVPRDHEGNLIILHPALSA